MDIIGRMTNSILDQIFEHDRLHNPDYSEEKTSKMRRMIVERMAKEPPPSVVLLGETGVGKSTTLNAMFNAGRPTSDTVACTQEASFVDIELAKGPLRIFDMPGIGESIETREKHFELYERILAQADVVIWILAAEHRPIEYVQRYLLEQLGPKNPKLASKIVFALNKVDLVNPLQWNPLVNMPGPQQTLNIEARVADVRQKILQVLPKWKGQVVAYSAQQFYQLPHLFLAILDAVPRGRRWTITKKQALADWQEKVDQRVLAAARKEAEPQTVEQRFLDFLMTLNDEEREALLGREESIRSAIGSTLTRK